MLKAFNARYRVTVVPSEADRADELLKTLKKSPQFKTDAQRLKAAQSGKTYFIVTQIKE
jgi:hypothetical protein